MYPVDVWLYYQFDSQKTTGINITDPAWDAGQRAIWPFDSTFTYEQGTRILNTLYAVFSKAGRVHPKTDCLLTDVTKHDTHVKPKPGWWACNNALKYIATALAGKPSCPQVTSPEPSQEQISWKFEDQGIQYSGISKVGKPRVICSPLVCESLWSMGLRSDQLVGYFLSVSDLCHGILCYQFHFETMTSVKGTGEHDIDLEKVRILQPDIIIDTAYMRNKREPEGLLKLSPQFDQLTQLGIPLIEIQVDQRDYMEVVDAMRSLAVALGGGPPNYDEERHCYMLHKAMEGMTSMGDYLRESGIRVLAASFSETHIYAAQPTSDPILIMLEQLGVPMMHVNAQLWEHDGGGYWEPIKLPKYDRNTANVAPLSGDAMYPVDVWLYDARSNKMGSRYHEENIVVSDPAWNAAQYAIWPVDGPFTYEQGARILNTLRGVFAKAKRVHPETDCTVANVSKRVMLPGGWWACLDQNVRQSYLAQALPFCARTTPPPPQDNLQTAFVADHAEARSPMCILLASMATVAMFSYRRT